MKFKKSEFYECLMNEMIKQEEYEMCCKLRDYMPYVQPDEFIDIADEEFDLSDFEPDEDYYYDESDWIDENDLE
jgi:hypothetical protein